MNHIDTIVQIEKEAEDILKKARKEATRLRESAEREKNAIFEHIKDAYPQKEESIVTQAEREANEEGLRIAKEGELHIASLREMAEKNKKKAVQFVLKSL